MHGGLRDRVLAALDASVPPLALWWVSVHGIYRPCVPVAAGLDWPRAPVGVPPQGAPGGELRDSRYHLPSRCFAYVGTASDPRTWRLPYLLDTGEPDTSRLPKAIQSILTNYRGAKVTKVPREAIPDVLVRLAVTAAALRKLPCQTTGTHDTYTSAHEALEQFGRLADVGCCS